MVDPHSHYSELASRFLKSICNNPIGSNDLVRIISVKDTIEVFHFHCYALKVLNTLPPKKYTVDGVGSYLVQAHLSSHGIPPWQVFQTASERVETEGLAALLSLTSCLSRSVLRADAEDLLDSFLSNILQGNGTKARKGSEYNRDDICQGPMTLHVYPPMFSDLGAAALIWIEDNLVTASKLFQVSVSNLLGL